MAQQGKRTDHQTIELIRRLLRAGWSIASTAREAGVSRPTVYRHAR